MLQEKFEAALTTDFIKLKKPTVFIAIIQGLLFILLYEIIAFILGIVFSYLAYFLDLIPVVGSFFYGKMSDGLCQTILPITIGYLLFLIMVLIFKKYYFSTVALIIDFMIISYLVIERIIYQGSSFGIMSYEFFTQIWFSIILCACIFIPFSLRSGLVYIFAKQNNSTTNEEN